LWRAVAARLKASPSCDPIERQPSDGGARDRTEREPFRRAAASTTMSALGQSLRATNNSNSHKALLVSARRVDAASAPPQIADGYR